MPQVRIFFMILYRQCIQVNTWFEASAQFRGQAARIKELCVSSPSCLPAGSASQFAGKDSRSFLLGTGCLSIYGLHPVSTWPVFILALGKTIFLSGTQTKWQKDWKKKSPNVEKQEECAEVVGERTQGVFIAELCPWWAGCPGINHFTPCTIVSSLPCSLCPFS